MSWSAEQLRLLRALGHEPMQLAPVGSPASSRGFGVAAADEGRPQAIPAPTNEFAALAAAIARAAGGRDVEALALDFGRLRREPGLKRALWPRLRALRRTH